MWPGCCGRYSSQIATARSGSPALRYSFANGAMYRRGFSSNFLRSSSMRADVAIDWPRCGRSAHGPKARVGRKRKIHSSDEVRQSEVTPSLDFRPSSGLTSRANFSRISPSFCAAEYLPMLQQMRSLAKYVWLLVALAFVGGFLLYETSGLIGRTPVPTPPAVAVVNGHELMYRDFIARVQNQMQSEQAQGGRSLTQDGT